MLSNSTLRYKLFLIVFLISASFVQLHAQVAYRAPSLYMKFQDHYEGDIILTSIRVPDPSPINTYYSAMNWNGGHDAGGYCGIQERNDGRVFIFSLWDPLSDPSLEVNTTEYVSQHTEIERFGGEGVGLKSMNFEYGWETDTWYTLASRNWTLTSDQDNTRFGFWFYDHGNQVWNHMVTMVYPVPNLRFYSSTSAFIEDWLGNGWDARTLQQKDGYKRKTSDGTWGQFTSAQFWRYYPDERLIHYIDNYDGGATTDGVDWYYWMTSGGTTQPVTNTGYNDMLYVPLGTASPDFETAQITNYQGAIENDEMISSWAIDASKLPQFSYHVEVFDNASFIGSPLLETEEVKPHLRADTIDISSLPDNMEYYIRFSLTDIFDNTSSYFQSSVIKGTPLHLTEFDLNGIEVFPNPSNDQVNITLPQKASSITIRSIDGATVYSCLNVEKQEVDVSQWSPGSYVVEILIGGQFITKKLLVN